jgi:hypothetical protein
MSDLMSAEPASVAPSGTKPSDRAAFAQIIALVFSVPAAIFSLFVVWGVATPGPCGDTGAGFPVVKCWLADLPLGVLNLAVSLFVRRGSPPLRRWCFRAGLVTLALPIIAQLLWSRWNCRF